MAPFLPPLAVYSAVAIAIACLYPFPSMFDERAHLSVIRAQFEHPDLFADTGRYMMVRADDLRRWSTEGNFLNHPPLYYLTLAPLLDMHDPVLGLRLCNVALSVGALIGVVWGGRRLLPDIHTQVTFAIIAASFPKAVLIGGMINNDNLAAVAAALVFAGIAGGPGCLIGLGLALAGWTKLTALIALAAVVGVGAVWNRHRDAPRTYLAASVGLCIGALPYLVSLLRTGHLFQVNASVYASLPGARPHWDFVDYCSVFFSELVDKWPAAEASLPRSVGVLLILIPFICAAIGAFRDARIRPIGLAYLGATVITLGIHIAFGWHSFQTIGDLTIAQTRYYNVLWPGLALVGAAGLGRLGRATPVIVLLYLLPTVVGGMVLALL